MTNDEINEWVISLTINKEDGFIPVNKISKQISIIGGVHKYNALCKVKDGNREYTINAMMNNAQRKVIEKELELTLSILKYKFCMV